MREQISYVTSKKEFALAEFFMLAQLICQSQIRENRYLHFGKIESVDDLAAKALAYGR
jgi:hypothetical protein